MFLKGNAIEIPNNMAICLHITLYMISDVFIANSLKTNGNTLENLYEILHFANFMYISHETLCKFI